MKIGILKEEKVSLDKRTPLTPEQCKRLISRYSSIELFVMSSDFRCFSDDLYRLAGVKVVRTLDHCDILMGIKEVPVDSLIPNKTYLFFSHTIKGQEYNMGLLSALLSKGVRMIDYELLKGNNGKRLIGFGRYAGIVGAYNGLLCYGLKNKIYNIKPAYKCENRLEMESQFSKISLKEEKIIVTGKGRVGEGIIEVLKAISIREVSKREFLEESFSEPVFVHLDSMDYNQRIDKIKGSKEDFYKNPNMYRSSFMKFAAIGDVFIAGHYYNQGAPFLFTRDDARNDKFNLSVVADISCDINGPIASTIRPSKISDPIYGYHPQKETEDDFKKNGVIGVMAVDNLPCELPKDASCSFGEELIESVIPLLMGEDPESIIYNATICQNGKLTLEFEYLKEFLI